MHRTKVKDGGLCLKKWYYCNDIINAFSDCDKLTKEDCKQVYSLQMSRSHSVSYPFLCQANYQTMRARILHSANEFGSILDAPHE